METGEITEDIPRHITVEMKSTMPEAGSSSSDSVRVIKKESFQRIIGSAPPETHRTSAVSLPTNKNGSSNPKDVPTSGKNNPRGSPGLFFTYLKTTQEESEKLGKWMIIFIEVVVCFLFLGGLIANLTGHLFEKNHVIWVLEPWKWCMLVLVIVGSRRITGWMMDVLVFLITRTFAVHSIEKIFLSMKYNVSSSYYIYSLGKSIRVVLWFGSVLLTWFFMFKSSGVKRSKLDSHVLKYIMRSLATFVIGGFLWVLKTLLVNALSSPFRATRLFDRFRESLIDQYILHTFFAEDGIGDLVKWINRNQLPLYDCNQGDGNVKVINWLKKIETEKISAWTMKELIEVIRSTQLSPNTEELENLAKKEQGMNILYKKTFDVSRQIFRSCFQFETECGGEITEHELRCLFKEEAGDVVQHINGEELAKEGEGLRQQALTKWLASRCRR